MQSLYCCIALKTSDFKESGPEEPLGRDFLFRLPLTRCWRRSSRGRAAGLEDDTPHQVSLSKLGNRFWSFSTEFYFISLACWLSKCRVRTLDGKLRRHSIISITIRSTFYSRLPANLRKNEPQNFFFFSIEFYCHGLLLTGWEPDVANNA